MAPSKRCATKNDELEAHLLTCLSEHSGCGKMAFTISKNNTDYVWVNSWLHTKIMSQTLRRSEKSRAVLFYNACLIQRNLLIGSHASSTCCYSTYMYLLWFHPNTPRFFPQQQLLQWFFTNTIQNGEILLIKSAGLQVLPINLRIWHRRRSNDHLPFRK